MDSGELVKNTDFFLQILQVLNSIAQLLRLENKMQLHSWSLIEKSQLINLATIGLDWSNRRKPITTIFAGTPPDFEMLLYTACFMMKPNQICHIHIDGQLLQVISPMILSGIFFNNFLIIWRYYSR